MRIGMSGPEVEYFVEKLRAGGDAKALEAASGVDPVWFEANRESLFRLAGLEAPTSDGKTEDPPPEGASREGTGSELAPVETPKRARASRKPKTTAME
jgi:hypothetical protein